MKNSLFFGYSLKFKFLIKENNYLLLGKLFINWLGITRKHKPMNINQILNLKLQNRSTDCSSQFSVPGFLYLLLRLKSGVPKHDESIKVEKNWRIYFGLSNLFFKPRLQSGGFLNQSCFSVKSFFRVAIVWVFCWRNHIKAEFLTNLCKPNVCLVVCIPVIMCLIITRSLTLKFWLWKELTVRKKHIWNQICFCETKYLIKIFFF
jgi:hypothetical protein